MAASNVTARKSSRPERSTAGTEDISVGVILGFPPEIADELQRWRASFGDPLAGVQKGK